MYRRAVIALFFVFLLISLNIGFLGSRASAAAVTPTNIDFRSYDPGYPNDWTSTDYWVGAVDANVSANLQTVYIRFSLPGGFTVGTNKVVLKIPYTIGAGTGHKATLWGYPSDSWTGTNPATPVVSQDQLISPTYPEALDTITNVSDPSGTLSFDVTEYIKNLPSGQKATLLLTGKMQFTAGNSSLGDYFIAGTAISLELVSQLPAAVTAAGSSGGAQTVTVSGATADATLMLYDKNNSPVGSQTAASGGTGTFTGVPYGTGYTVKQTTSAGESPASNAVTVAPGTVTVQGSSGTGQITASGAEAGATLQLYNSSNAAVGSPIPVVSGAGTFTSVAYGTGYYVKQTVNGAESAASSAVTVAPGAVTAAGSVDTKQISVTGAENGATLKLYNSLNSQVGSSQTAAAGGIGTFTNVAYGAGYYVKQTVNGAESGASNAVKSDDTPVITVTGNTTVYTDVGQTYTDAGATASDALDGDLTSQIQPTSTVNTNVPGSYTVTYNVADSENNAAVAKTRTVLVRPAAVTLQGSSGTNTVTVSGAISGASLQLYDSANATVGVAILADGSGGGVFTGVAYGTGYYVKQTVNGAESAASSAVTVAPGAVTAAGSVGTKQISATNAENGAALKLYDNQNQRVGSAVAAAAGGGTFTNVPYGVGYTVTQTMNGAESGKSQTAGVLPEAVTAAGSVDTGLITVTGAEPAASLQLYNSQDQAIGSPVTATGTGQGTVTNVAYGMGYYIKQTVNGAESGASNSVTVDDKPVITLTGNATVYLTAGQTYTDAGATASDAIDGSLTNQIQPTGTVTNTTPGSYTITYNVTDSASNAAAPVERTVIVKPVPVTAQGSSGVQTVSVSGAGSGSLLKLYDSLNNPVGSAQTANPAGAVTFVSVPYGSGYTVTQTVNGIESDKSTPVDVWQNTPPTISPIANVAMNRDESTAPLAFTVSDGETAAAQLSVTSGTSDSTLIPLSGIAISGTGEARTVTVTPAANRFGAATVTLTVYDADQASSYTQFQLTVNDLPTISPVNDQSIHKNGSLGSIAFQVADSETAASSLLVEKASSNTLLLPLNGITISGSGGSRTVAITPAANQVGEATVTLTVYDANQAKASTSFKVAVGNTKPVVQQPGVVTVEEDGTASIQLQGADVDQDPLSFSVVQQGLKGTAFINGAGILTYTPNPDENGADSVTVAASDGTVSSDPVVIVVTITPVNDKPVAVGASYSVTGLTQLVGVLSATDVDGDPLTYRIVRQGTKQSVNVSVYGNTFFYVPAPGESGDDEFSFTAFDGIQESDPAVVRISIVPAGVADLKQLTTSAGSLTPAFDANVLEYRQTVAYNVVSANVTANVYDPGASVTIAGQPGPVATISALQVGDNAIPVTVTSHNRAFSKMYTVHISRLGNADLTALSTSAGAFSPAFDPAMTVYEMNVPSYVRQMTVTASAYDAATTIRVNGTPVISGSPTAELALSVGYNTITVEVASLDNRTAKTYTLTVRRAAEQPSSPSSPPSSAPSAGGSTVTPAGSTGVEVIVDGVKQEQSATANTVRSDNRTVTTITVDNDKVIAKMEKDGNKVLTIPFLTSSDVVIAELNGQLVKAMESKDAVVEIRTERAAYWLPALEIKIDDISRQIGQQVDLQDIKITVTIAEAAGDKTELVRRDAGNQGLTVLVKPVEFAVTAIYGDKKVDVAKFNSYVERTIALPDDVDPNKITTGVVLGDDGKVRHVPTKVVKENERYFAVINSLTNSTYSVVWNPKTFADVETHWSKADVNDLASRLVIQGASEQAFMPDQPITRAEFATIAVRALGLKPGTGAQPFRDVKAEDWYDSFTRTAAEYALISGYEDGEFGANRNITREEAFVIVARMMKVVKLESAPAAAGQTWNFTDESDIGTWAKQSAIDAANAGLVQGSFGQLRPKALVTRAETATMIHRLLGQSGLINK